MPDLDRILLPVDFSERSVGAAQYVEAVAARCDCRITLLHVLPPPHYEFSALEVGGTVLNELFANRSARAREELDGFLREELASFRVERVLLEGDPARKIVEYAHDEKAGLIIVPTHGYGPFRRFILGSVTAKILHDSDCPVLTGVHLEQTPAAGLIRLETILAALDMGPQSKKTLDWAARMARRFGAKLLATYVIPCLESKAGEYYNPDWRAHAEQECRAQIAQLEAELDCKADELLLEMGDPPTVICEAAARVSADLLVIGRGSAAGQFGRLRANAYTIIRQSPCPVVSV